MSERERMDAYIAKVVASAPPLSIEQRARLARLLRPETDRLVIDEAATVLAEMRRAK